MPRRWIALAGVFALVATPAAAQDDEGVRARVGKFVIEERGYFIRLVYDGTLIGTQIIEPYIVRADAPNLFGLGTQWEALALVGAHGRWNPVHEPLTYYHRTGPVGAMFYHLRTRKGGADAAAPVGVVGLYAGTPAAYALRGQKFTFYSAHTELKKLVAGSDEFFTYIPDARDRGARFEYRYGPPRRALAADADKRFALLLVEMVEEGFDPGDRLTLEAVRLYLDRVTPDGVVALHTSNKFYNLEPVVERIARELKLVGRVWNDDAEGRPGKTAATWVVLARSEAALGPLARPLVEQVLTFGTRNDALADLIRRHGPDARAVDVMWDEWGGPVSGRLFMTPSLMTTREGPYATAAFRAARLMQERGELASLGRVAEVVCGRMFRPLVADPTVELRTDDNESDLPLPPPPKK